MSDRQNIKHLLASARNAFKTNDLDATEKNARKLLQLDGQHQDALRLLGRVLNRKSQWQDAFPYWKKLAKLDPTRAEYHFQAGRLATRIDQEETALAYLQQTLTLSPGHEKALTLLAKTHQKLQQWAQAFTNWHALYQITPEKNDLEKRLTLCARKIEDTDRRKTACQHLLNINPNHLEALRFLAVYHTDLQRWQEANHCWRKLHELSSLKLEDLYSWEQAAAHVAPEQQPEIWQKILLNAPKDANILRKIARYHSQKEEWQAAKEYLDLLVKIDPEDIDLCRQWANAAEHNKTGKNEAAWKRLYELAPEDRTALLHLAKAAYTRKKWADSILYWGKLCDLSPQNEEYWSYWAYSHVKNKTHNLHHIWETVLAHFPDKEEYWVHWANSHNQNNTTDLLHIWENVLKHCPKNAQALRILATEATQVGQWENAYSLWSRLCALTEVRVTDLRSWARSAEKRQKPTNLQAWQRVLEHQPEDPEALKQLARHLTAQENWQEATYYWERYKNISEQDESSWIQWARAASKTSPREQFTIWLQVHTHFPCNIEALKHLARQTWEAEDWLASADYWGKLHTLSQDKNSLLSQARALTKADSVQAHPVWEKILDHNPDDPEALRNLARLKVRNECWQDAIYLWDRLLKQTPHDPWVLVQKGRVLKQIDDDDALEHHWQYILSLFPDHIEGLTTLGRLAARQQNWQSARAYWDHLHKIDPAMVEPPLQIARSYIAHGRQDSAEKYLHLVLQLDPYHTEALTGLVQLLRQQNRENEILQLCREWKTARPHDIRPHLLLARSLSAQSNDKVEIIQAWQDLLAIDAENLEGLISLARLHQANSAYPQAETYWKKVCQLDKNNATAWANRIRILDKTYRPDDIPPLLEQVKNIFDNSLEGLCAKAEAYEAARYFDSAQECWHEAASIATDQVAPKEKYADFLLRQGKISHALIAYHDARELAPYSTKIATALIQITRTFMVCGHDGGAYLKQTPNQPALRTPEVFYPVVRHKAKERGVAPAQPKKRLRVMLVTGSLGPGGAERQLVQTACAMKHAQERVEKVTVLVNSLSGTPTSSFFLHQLEDADIEVIEYGATVPEPLPEFKAPEERQDADLLSLFPRIRREALLRLYHIFKQERPDIVHAWQDTTAIDATTAAILAGVARILISTRSLRPDHHRRLLPYLRPAYRELLQLPQVQLSNNSLAGLKDYAAWLDLDLDETLVTPNGIDTHKLRTNCTDQAVCDLRRRLHIPDGAPVVGGVMRFTEEKRPLLWIRAMISVAQQIAEAHFILVGDGPMHSQAQGLVGAHNLEQRIHLVKNSKNIAPWYGLMDLLVLTSRLEGCPNVLLEAQSLGVPVITLDVGGAGETVIKDQTGRIVCAKPEGLEERLSKEVVKCLNDPIWIKQAKEKAPRFVDQNFSLSSALNKTLEAFDFMHR